MVLLFNLSLFFVSATSAYSSILFGSIFHACRKCCIFMSMYENVGKQKLITSVSWAFLCNLEQNILCQKLPAPIIIVLVLRRFKNLYFLSFYVFKIPNMLLNEYSYFLCAFVELFTVLLQS